MSAAKHTPGPWTIQRYVVDRLGNEVSSFARGNLTERLRIVADPAPMIVADMVAGGGADARLIAAAPDLLDVMTRCEALLSSITSISTDLAPFRDSILRQARAVIAKAEGGQ